MGLFSDIFGGSESSTSPSKVWGGQTPFLRGLYQRAFDASLGLGAGGRQVFGGSGGNGSPGSLFGNVIGTGVANQNAQTFADPLQGLGVNLTQQGQGFLGNLGQMGQAGNPFAMGQINQLGQQLGTVFNQQVLPGIQSTFGQSGTLGGDRQALAMGQAAGQFGQAFTGGALDILGNSAQLALNANQAGLGGLGNVFGMGNAATFGSLPGLASLLGPPTVLGGGGSSSSTPGVLGGLGALFGGG